MANNEESDAYYETVKQKLRGKGKKELLELLAEVAEYNWDVGRFILERAMMDSGDMEKLVESLLAEIRSVTSEPAWGSEWSGEGHIPDYSHLQQQFASLEKRGCADALLKLGEELWKRGNDQLGKANDEGETGTAIAECMEIVIRAIPKSSLSKPQQLLWAIERQSTDNYDILPDEPFDFMKSGEYGEADWREVAYALESRLLAIGDKWFRRYFVNWLLHAYRSGGLEDRVIPLLEREGDYEELVKVLLREGRREEAKRTCILGYETYVQKGGFPPDSLHDQLLEMAEAEGQYGLAGAYCWDDFCDHASDESYVKLRDVAEKAGCWPAVREAALRFLKTGSRPDHPGEGKEPPTGKTGKKAAKQKWPLPPTEVAHLYKEKPHFSRNFPMTEALLRVAILEKRLDDVIKLHRVVLREQKRSDVIAFGIHIHTANAVSDQYPDVALSIWRFLLDTLLIPEQEGIYKIVEPCLSDMKLIYEKTNRLDEWKALISELKTKHKSNHELLEGLTALE